MRARARGKLIRMNFWKVIKKKKLGLQNFTYPPQSGVADSDFENEIFQKKNWGPEKSNLWYFALVCNLLTPERARLRRFIKSPTIKGEFLIKTAKSDHSPQINLSNLGDDAI